MLQTINYKNGFEEGISPVFDTLGVLKEIITYKKGFITNREVLNRYDKEGKKHGYWKTFFEDWSLHTECYYRHGLRDGFYKEYDKQGNLKKITKYVNDIEQVQESGLKPLVMQYEYFPNGQVKREASFRDGKKEGVWREFDEKGNVINSQTYIKGALISNGIVGTDGKRRGEYKEFFADSTLRAEGIFIEANYGISKDKVDVVEMTENKIEASAGDLNAYNEMIEFATDSNNYKKDNFVAMLILIFEYVI